MVSLLVVWRPVSSRSHCFSASVYGGSSHGLRFMALTQTVLKSETGSGEGSAGRWATTWATDCTAGADCTGSALARRALTEAMSSSTAMDFDHQPPQGGDGATNSAAPVLLRYGVVSAPPTRAMRSSMTGGRFTWVM